MITRLKLIKWAALLVLFSIINHQPSTFAQGTAFTYQGRLNNDTSPANGSYDLRFNVFDNSVGGNQQGPMLTSSATSVSDGLFTVALDFGNQFPGADRWLEIAVRTNGNGSFFTLIPRQALTPAPYAITAGSVVSGGLTGTYGNAVSFNNANNNFSGAFTGNGANVTNVNATTLGGLGASGFWKTNGNAGANPTNGAFFGTTDTLPLEFKVNGQRALRIAYATNSSFGYSPNILGGLSGNIISNGFVGAVIGGGGYANNPNVVGNDLATVVGGAGNIANGVASTAMGYSTTANGFASIAMGEGSTASGAVSTAMGNSTTASTAYATAMGNTTTASGSVSTAMGGGTTASGDYSTAMGFLTTASGDYSTAMGHKAQAIHLGSFVWADSQLGQFTSSANNQFLIRAAGGVGIGVTNPTSPLHIASAGNTPQVQITQNTAGNATRLRMNVTGSPFWEMDVAGGATPSISWWTGTVKMNLDYNGNLTTVGTVNGSSDRNVKEHFSPVSARDVLEKVSSLPITEWNYITDGGTLRHIGPMAQDFYAAFSVGTDDKHISMVDADGVALAAIQGLNQKVEEERAASQAKDARIALLEADLQKLKQMMNKLADSKN